MSLPPRRRSPPSSSRPGRSPHVAHDRHLSTPLTSFPFENAPHSITGAVFTPSSPPVITSRLRTASSSSQLDTHGAFEHDRMNEDGGVLYAVGVGSDKRNGHGFGLKSRIGPCPSKQRQEKPISTGPQKGAGETETELDEPPSHLPTFRKIPTPPPLTPPTPLARVTPLLFQIFRLLSVVPAVAGACYHLLNMCQPRHTHSRLDHLVCVFWALLTAHQCLRLTTGLLTRWKTFYPPLPTLIRLLALQAICWPATQYTLVLFNHERRPVICWAIIGSTTCVSRSIQIWVTSNLWGPSNHRVDGNGPDAAGIQWGPRRWDWTEVGISCAFPMGVVYFVMAWAEALRRELSGC